MGASGKPLAAILKSPNVINKLMISKRLANNGEKITNAMIGNDVFAIYWQLLVNWLCKALDQIGNDW